eukprot:SAG31_NODE_10357_length_1149_cov_0.940000_2_plen_28_part_01
MPQTVALCEAAGAGDTAEVCDLVSRGAD